MRKRLVESGRGRLRQEAAFGSLGGNRGRLLFSPGRTCPGVGRFDLVSAFTDAVESEEEDNRQ